MAKGISHLEPHFETQNDVPLPKETDTHTLQYSFRSNNNNNNTKENVNEQSNNNTTAVTPSLALFSNAMFLYFFFCLFLFTDNNDFYTFGPLGGSFIRPECLRRSSSGDNNCYWSTRWHTRCAVFFFFHTHYLTNKCWGVVYNCAYTRNVCNNDAATKTPCSLRNTTHQKGNDVVVGRWFSIFWFDF